MTRRPIVCRFDGHQFVPEGNYHLRNAATDYEDGALYRLAPVVERSMSSHRHYFACINEAWKSLPEKDAGEPWAQSAEHLRHYALIQTGFATCVESDCGSNAAALRVAAMTRAVVEYAVVQVSGSAVRVWRARSQSNRAMPKDEFQASKEAVLNWIAQRLGVTPETLARQSEAA
ncbi:MAG: hypothetical protein GC208_09500 [Alphaproteobacteria bacterium]|nr:hypothetical protein [Alphaproteobacteria bacterium]